MKETKDDTNIMIDIPYWKNQYCENDHTTQNKYDSYQITNGIFSQKQNKRFGNFYRNTEYPEKPKQS